LQDRVFVFLNANSFLYAPLLRHITHSLRSLSICQALSTYLHSTSVGSDSLVPRSCRAMQATVDALDGGRLRYQRRADAAIRVVVGWGACEGDGMHNQTSTPQGCEGSVCHSAKIDAECGHVMGLRAPWYWMLPSIMMIVGDFPRVKKNPSPQKIHGLWHSASQNRAGWQSMKHIVSLTGRAGVGTGSEVASRSRSGLGAAWRGAGDGERLALIGACLAPSSRCGAIARSRLNEKASVGELEVPYKACKQRATTRMREVSGREQVVGATSCATPLSPLALPSHARRLRTSAPPRDLP
jgi:hypothetical protein